VIGPREGQPAVDDGGSLNLYVGMYGPARTLATPASISLASVVRRGRVADRFLLFMEQLEQALLLLESGRIARQSSVRARPSATTRW
jgi:hypothetical protein